MTKRRVLVVDDDPDQIRMLALLLRESGHRVECATNALYALTLAKEFNPEFVFLDIGMPYMDGYEAVRRFRAAFPAARMFAITGRSGDEARRKSADAGFEDHLVKPIEVAVVERILQ
ncbi:MAG TPA: response regulator [Burkholderiales bacterium]|nr:response regulator [Burkholderiales bacterium]